MKGNKKHATVLLTETVGGLSLAPGNTAVDATVGTGGHAKEIAERIGAKGTLLCIDADEKSIARSKERLKDSEAKLIFVQGNFRNLKTIAHEAGIDSAEGILFDLGWHTEQLTAGKGFSFKSNDPLLMTLSERTQTLTAKDIIADWDEDEIAKIIREYGEERFSGRIARAIVETRKEKEIDTADFLAEIIAGAVPGFYRRSRLHPATRTFQALRIAVNDELNALTEALGDALDLLSPGGRLAVISFHSLEDRIVKRVFRAAEDSGRGKRITKKPIVPSQEERSANPRARSAKLRIFNKRTNEKT
ncbi:MAG: 16S rRNA (cytosine(1402)-N(4))-methyltransferase RsmH [Patescibacteria group bacterium]|nr:16S rRNA (cytosine(1402)-N(4))-methyltransferase RsmH [Patescibacteria group bacterium]